MKVICKKFEFCKNKMCRHKIEHEKNSFSCLNGYCYHSAKKVNCVPAILELRKLKIKKLDESNL